MKKRIFLCFCFVLLLLTITQSLSVTAIAESDSPCSLTLQYINEENFFSDVNIQIFQVADHSEDGSYSLSENFAEYPVKINDITSKSQWKEVTQALISYAVADDIKPTVEALTDEMGTVVFEDLKTGLYLVAGVDVKKGNIKYRFDSFLVSLPTPNNDEKNDYDIEARPKCSEISPITQYTITKLWKDSGASSNRPKSVTVDIIENAQVKGTVILNAENNWSYTWKTSDDTSDLYVIEKNVPDGYTVSITEKDNTFTIINTSLDPPVTSPPKTGDTTPYLLYISFMCISGVICVLLSVWRKRA